ncbi:hypothetical protein L345_16179, partial [Ophiophagus hannah]
MKKNTLLLDLISSLQKSSQPQTFCLCLQEIIESLFVSPDHLGHFSSLLTCDWLVVKQEDGNKEEKSLHG